MEEVVWHHRHLAFTNEEWLVGLRKKLLLRGCINVPTSYSKDVTTPVAIHQSVHQTQIRDSINPGRIDNGVNVATVAPDTWYGIDFQFGSSLDRESVWTVQVLESGFKVAYRRHCIKMKYTVRTKRIYQMTSRLTNYLVQLGHTSGWLVIKNCKIICSKTSQNFVLVLFIQFVSVIVYFRFHHQIHEWLHRWHRQLSQRCGVGLDMLLKYWDLFPASFALAHS